MVPLADLDALYVAAATEGKALERIADAREQVAALVANEEATLASLHRSLGE